MRRLLALLLAFTLGVSVMPAGLAVEGDGGLPACCRRDGKHKCGMNAARQTPSGEPVFRQAPCAQYPAGSLTAPVERDELPVDAGDGIKTPVQFGRLTLQPARFPRSIQVSPAHPRGPPVLL